MKNTFLTLSLLLAFFAPALPALEPAVTVEMEVPAMTCSGCSWAVTQSLKKLDNVSAVYVDAKSKKAVLEVSSKDAPGKAAILDAVKKSGYQAKKFRVTDERFSAAKKRISASS